MTRRLGPVLCLLALACAGQFRFDDGQGDAGPPASADGGGCACADGGACVGGACPQCVRDGDCPGALCDVGRGRCLVACDRRNDTCDRGLYRRGCRDDLGAPRCTMCEDAEGCAPGRLVCAGGLCVECDSSADCDGRPCDRVTGRCAPVAP